MSQSAISDIERGHLDRYTIASVRRVLRALDARAELDVIWRSRGDLERLLDADHARIVEAWAERHVRADWAVWPEAGYSVYGERGRIDLLCFHPRTGTVEVVEAKTGIWNVNETLGLLDAKARLTPRIVGERGWNARRIVRCLVVLGGTTQRRRVDEFAAQFGTLDIRGSAARAFIRDPARVDGDGILAFVELPPTKQGRRSLAGRRRVRRQSLDSRPEPILVGSTSSPDG